MIRFLPSIRNSYPSSAKYFDAIEMFDARLRAYLKQKLEPQDFNNLTVPLNTCSIFQVFLRRSIDIAEATVRELSCDSIVPCLILTRALLETVSIPCDVQIKVGDLLHSPKSSEFENYQNFKEAIKRIGLGSRTAGVTDIPTGVT